MEYNWDQRGADKDLLAKKWLGEDLYKTNKLKPQKERGECMDRPIVKPGDVITIGKEYKKAVVCKLQENNEIEIVYMGNKDDAINENACWNGSAWEFSHPGPCGGYADNNPRLKEFVGLLRNKTYNGYSHL
ncbi:MAG: hypothetical protein KJ661_07430 [Candidatus Omnitrophica bacterium]|nr:hypothetical protein [Candidatus Omnitrophota bacterium]